MTGVEMRYGPADVAAGRGRGGMAASDMRMFWIGGIGLALLSILLFLLGTRHGIGILPDSTRYMGISDRPYDAPMYSWFLDLIAATGSGMTNAAENLGLFLVCANTLLAWYLLVRSTGSYAYAAVGTGLIVLSPQFVSLHSVAMSEPLFMFWVFLALLLLLQFWETGNRAWLVGCGVAIGLTALVRFTAPPLGAAVAMGLLLNPRDRLARRIADAALIAIVGTAIFLLWAFLSEMTVGHSIGRELRFHGNMDAKAWKSSLMALAAWLAPRQLPGMVRVALFAVVAAGSAWLTVWQGRRVLLRAHNEKIVEGMLPIVLGFFLLFYLAFMVLATSIEANLSLTSRYACPAYVTSVIMMTIVVAEAGGAKGAVGHLQRAFPIFAAILLASHAFRTTARTRHAYNQGIGYASTAWARSPTMRAIAGLPAGTMIYSNGPDVIGYVLKRRAFYIPAHVLVRTGEPDPANPFDRQIAALREQPAARPTVIALFDKVDWRFYLATEAELNRSLDLSLLDRERDGRLYLVRPIPSPEVAP